MKAHTPFELPDIAFPVPFGMEKHLSQVLNRTYRVEVEWMQEGGAKDKVNGVDLEVPKEAGDNGEMTAEEMCQVVLAMGYMHHEQDEAEDARVYRVRQYWKDDKGKDRRKFFKFTVRPAGDVPGAGPRQGAMGHDGHDQVGWQGIDGPDDARWEMAQRNVERTQRQMVDANGMVMRQVDMTLNTILRANSQVLEEQRKMNEENRIALREARQQTSSAQDRLFKMAIALTAHNEQQEAIQNKSLEMFTMGYQWFWYGMQQQVQGNDRRHREELERLQNDKASENRWSFLTTIGPAVLMFGGGLLSKMGNGQLGDFLQGVAEEAAEAQASAQAAGPGGAEPGAPAGFEQSPQPSAYVPPPPGFAPPTSAPSYTPPTMGPPTMGPPTMGPPTMGPPTMGPPSAAPAKPAPAAAASFDHLTLLEKAHRFGELFSAQAWQTLRTGMNELQITALEKLVTVQDPLQVALLLHGFTVELRREPAGDDTLSRVLTREQVELVNSMIGEMQTQDAGRSTPPTPGSPSGVPPTGPVIPSPPPSPMPAGFAPLQGPNSPGEQGRSAPTDGSTGGHPADGAEVHAFLSAFKLPEATIDELVENYPTLAELRATPDERLLGLYGIGPVMLRKLRTGLDE